MMDGETMNVFDLISDDEDTDINIETSLVKRLQDPEVNQAIFPKRSSVTQRILAEDLSRVTSSEIVVFEEEGLEECHNCGRCHRLLRCSRCKFRRYCSKACQREDYVAEHRRDCKRWSKFLTIEPYVLPPAIPNFLERVVIRQVPLLDEICEKCHATDFESAAQIVVEIRKVHQDIKYAVHVQDLTGQRAVVRICTGSKYYTERTYNYQTSRSAFRSIPYNSCLVPGNFLVINHAYRFEFPDGAKDIRVHNVDSLQVIFHSETSRKWNWKENARASHGLPGNREKMT